jgi:hypothetical protein
MEMDDTPIMCPWCQTEIVWDEELGPEKHCPHCENELSGYRTISLNAVGDDKDDDEDQDLVEEDETDDLDREEGAGFRRMDPRLMVIEEKVERILDGQEEVPECPSCREYMVETGRQQVGGSGFEPVVHEEIGKALIDNPFHLVWFVCPSCFQMQNRLSAADRDEMLRRLSTGK